MAKGGEDVKKYHSITELEELTNIPDSTIRRYIAKFPDFFILQEGRMKKYEESAVKVLVRIKHLFDIGRGTKEIDSLLRNDFPMVVSGDEEVVTNTPTLATADDIVEIKDLVYKQTETIEKQSKVIEEFSKRLDQQQEFIDNRLKERDRLLLKSIDERLETQKQIVATTEKEEKKSWWARLFGK